MEKIKKPEIIRAHVWLALTAADHRLLIKYFKLLAWWYALPWRLIKADAYLTILYFILLRPPLRHFIEIPLIIGASVSTLIITYTAADFALALRSKAAIRI